MAGRTGVLSVCLFLLLVPQDTSQNTRNKRQIQPEQPRILTQNGHLLFQSGTNHNITFRATAGGYINVNGDNLAVISQTVKNNKLAIDQLRTSPTASSGLESRLSTVENRLNNLVPTGQVQTSLLTLGHRIEMLQATIPGDVNTRLSQLEASLSNLQPTGEVETLLTQLGSRVTTLTRRVRRLQTRVQTLETRLSRNECTSNPCINGGTCEDSYNGYICRCPETFQGPTCSDDVNECAIYTGTDLGCQNGATCSNTVGGFTCQCASNFHGVRCTERHDDCTGASSTELCGHGTCVNLDRVQAGQPKYRCICDDGWTSQTSDPACTVDVNECSGNTPRCSVNPPVPCINLPGSFTCGSCPAGYNGNGFSCVDINECEQNNGGCSTAPRVQCVNTAGSRTCGPCPPSFQGDGVTCTWVSVCQTNNGGCYPTASCTENPGFQGRVCTCPPGYVGNGIGPSGCVSQGPITGPCGSSPCMNGAACQNMGTTGYRCVCQAGYSGRNCQTNINECASNPCQNGGSCMDRVNGYACQCTDTYTGANCDVEQNTCGGMLTGETGTFRYPSTPGNSYPHDVSCAWRVTTTPNKILMITFPEFNVEAHAQCSYDFLQVHDGPTASSYVIGKYCGTTPPNSGQPINSTHNQLYFWFRSDTSIASDGFRVQWTSALPVCGGNLAGSDHGAISSPGYPGNYPLNRDCVWTVTVSPGKLIMFTFATLAMEIHPNCSYDYLELRDGGLDTSPLLNRYCNMSTPPPQRTTGPTAFVKFHSDGSHTDAGFHITYAAIPGDPGCGGSYTSDSGTLVSPNYPNPYDHHASCVWLVTVSLADTITFTFTNMALEGGSSCPFDYVELRDGNNENSALIGRYCGNTVPVARTTNGNSLYVKFFSDGSVNSPGFRGTWTVSCGGTFTAPTGIIQTPYFPQPYPSDRTCEYFINQPQGMRIILTFAAFDVEDSDCAYDYLEIRDGSSSSPILHTFCGSQIPGPVSTTGNSMYLKFVTDGSVQNNGFQASYTAEEGAGCGGPLTTDMGEFQSPGHPNVYPHGVNCSWHIQVSPGMVIRLTFHTFSLESQSSCLYDAVTIYDSATITPEGLVDTYCGNQMPPVMTSTDNVMTILFRTDSSVAHDGFTASYVSLNASTLCGSTLTDSTGMITSPNFPDNYPHERDCRWTIIAPEGNQILLNITDFALESHSRCRFDFLEIRNGGFPSSPLVGTYCGTQIDRIITSHSNRMFIRLVTDRSMTTAGFRLYYDSTATGCGADLITPTGSFVSPNYPMPYGHNAECFWTITASRGSTIQLTIIDIEIESHHSCRFDYIEVHDNGANGRLLGKFCGSTVPDPVTSLSNRMWVKYRTDYSISGRGFHAFYNSICNTVVTGYSGVIESPNFPSPYPHNRNCTWVIAATMGNTINISFSHFDIESHSDCNFDYLQIRDGNTVNANELGTYCGSNLPPPVASTGDHVWVKFVSDYSVARNGFRLEYITNGCGGYLSSATGTFTSPGYPNPYPHRRQCEWKIVVATGSYIQLTIATFDLESHTSCRFDVLEIYGGPDDTGPQLARLCHTQSSPQVLSTTGNTMFVRFKSDFSVNGQGFSASYKTATGGCGGNYSTASGSITSKNFPNNYPHNTSCEWLITVAETRTVVLTFTDFDVEGSGSCPYDYVAVYDGPDNTYPELLKYCGSSLPVPSLYHSSGNQMYVRMRTDLSVSARGFKADYITGCGGVLNAEQDGALISPNYPDNYPRGSNCSWLIMADHAVDRITLTFTDMDIETRGQCSNDYVLVFDGNDNAAPQVGRYCGTTVPAPITSQGSALFVQFMSDMSMTRPGFRAVYSKSTAACGGDFTAESGSIMSPNYPNGYPLNTECIWTFRVSPGNRIQLSFSTFMLEEHESCNSDYVELHEGQLGGPLIGRFCGTSVPTNLTSYNGLWMKFRSDESETQQGFIAQFSTMYGGTLTGTSGQVGSPKYPAQYPHNVDYVWTITVPVGMRVDVTFTTLSMESSAQGCSYDFLKFRDGGASDSPVLGTYCGTTLPDRFISTTNVLYVEFHTDWSSSGQGFLFNWLATSDLPITTLPPTDATTPVPGCGGMLNVTDAAQTFTSPGYPGNYQHNLNCVWQLRARTGSRVWMNITYIDTEANNGCSYDSLKLYRYANAGGTPSGTYCGRTGNEQPVVSSSYQAAVRFTTDYSVNRGGFVIQYKAVCGGDFRTNNGVIRSPHYPSNYPVNSNCTWTARVPNGRTIRVTLDPNFSIQGTQGSCGGDYLKLQNGYTSASPPLGDASDGRYCGNGAPASMETSSQYLYVTFGSDSLGTASGFSLSFTEVHLACGGQLTLDASTTSGVFTSPNYPSVYPQNVDCVWVITAPASERIQIDFQDNFSIESHSQCRYDFIEFRDGGTVNSPSLGKLCGTTRPGTVFSTGNVMYARFRTDFSIARVGFKVNYKIATCGGRYVGNSGTIISPNYPSNYDNNEDCVWVVEAPEDHYMTFTFSVFQLQWSSNCSSGVDYLEIREINATGDVILQACGTTTPSPVRTANRYARLRFKTNEAVTAQGFSVSFQASQDVCGGELTTPSGTFTSPNFPNSYPSSRMCWWRITVPQGRSITFNFNPFNVDGRNNRCYYDYVMVYNGMYSDSPRVGRYCGDTPQTVEVSGNTARVLFHTDGSNTNGGFRATYSSNNAQACGGLITSSPGNISSPGFPTSNYTNNLQCIWTLRNQQYYNTSIVIRINSMRLEPVSSCRYDFLELREGDDINGVLLSKLCGADGQSLAPIISPSPAVWARLRTDSSRIDTGFHVSYNFTQCGGMLTASSGVITSPNYPNNYDHNDACAWQITAPEGAQVVLTTDAFDIEYHPNCRYDYLEIFNGPYASSPSAGKLCGTNYTRTIRSQGSALRLVFFTDGSMSGRGFQLSYRFETGGCGGLFHGPSGNFSTPNYPGSYPHNSECIWDINVQSGYVVSLTFLPPFDMEYHGTCDYDYVEVSDTYNNGSLRSLGRWCSNIMPPVMMSKSHRIVVKFRSDPSTNGNGFSARWETSCGGVITDKRGELTSPGYPNNYANNLRCNYTLAMDPNHFIVLRFVPNAFNLESGSGCRYDYVAVYAGNSSDGRRLGKFCGTTAPQPQAALGQMYVQFFTDRSVVRPGFRATYSVNECGGVYTEPWGVIATPTHPVSYLNNHNCTWNITVQPDMVVNLKFQSFDLETHSTCRWDYLDIYDGPTTTSPLIGRYCGNVVPSGFIQSSSNTMTINFITDSSVTRDGFRATYRATYGPSQGCGGMLNTTTGRFGSVDADGDGQYERYLDCRWTIMAPDNKIIRLTMTGLDLEANPTCRYDYIKVYDGISMDDPLVGTYCGDHTPPVIKSTTNVMFVQFYSDVSIGGAGFNASYTLEDSVCGGVYTSTSTPQRITSPGYPNPFRQFANCRWTIGAPSSTDRVYVNVTAINLQSSANCTSEYIAIRDYPLGAVGRSVHACGTTPPPSFTSFGQTIQIDYTVTDGASTGFTLNFLTGGCNRTYTGTSGQIYSPGWPVRYPRQAYCQSVVQVAAGTYVSLYFNTFTIERHRNCRYDYLQVHNGSDPSSPVIRQMCGYAVPDPIFATTNAVLLIFATDTSIQHQGYDITYTASTNGPGCGGQIFGINGSLTSPGYPGNYTEAGTCIWQITVPARRLVTLTFTDMRMFDTPNCATDSVTLYDGNSQANQYAHYCGQEIPAPVTALGTEITVMYASDGVGSSLGFRLTFTS